MIVGVVVGVYSLFVLVIVLRKMCNLVYVNIVDKYFVLGFSVKRLNMNNVCVSFVLMMRDFSKWKFYYVCVNFVR